MTTTELRQLPLRQLLHRLRSQLGVALQTEAQAIHPHNLPEQLPDSTLLLELGDFAIHARFKDS